VAAVDEKLNQLVAERRDKQHVVIDSHPVTKESYGFRVTPFTIDDLRKLSPTLIVVLLLSADQTRARITSDAQGRPVPTIFEADFHTHLQATVAFTYAFELGARIYYLDAGKPREQLVQQMRGLLDR